jgi:hypothetical protein
MNYPISRGYPMQVDRVEPLTAARLRARAERARRFLWAVGEVDARRIDQYAAECEAEARRLERERDEAMA